MLERSPVETDGIELRDGTRIQVRPVEDSDAEAAFVIADAWRQQRLRLLEVGQTFAILVRCDFTTRHPIGQDRTGVVEPRSRLMSGTSCDEPHDERDDGDHEEHHERTPEPHPTSAAHMAVVPVGGDGDERCDTDHDESSGSG